MKDHYYAVIMAGGGGTRLWPVSRRGSPKQTLKLFDDRSLFQLAIDRLEGFLPLEHIFVVTSAEQVERLHDQKPELNLSNFLVEPQPRGTAAVVAMAAAALRKIDADAVLAVLTADHLIGNVEEFPAGSVTPDRVNRLYIVREKDGAFLALSLTCPHLGCSVLWNEETQQFDCPCHSSAFDRRGVVLSSPAPRPLDYLPVTIEEGKVKVDMAGVTKRKRFEPNQLTYAL